jgi:AraC-like DNA-binding protein
LLEKWQKSSTVIQWVVSYAALAAIAALTLAISASAAQSAIRGEIVQTSGVVLGQVGNAIDRMIAEIGTMADTIRINPAVVKASHFGGELSGERRYMIASVMQELRKLTSLADRYSNYYLYFSNSDMIILPSGIMSSRKYYDAYGLGGRIGYAEWLGVITAGRGGRFHDIGGSGLLYVNRDSVNFGETAQNLSIVIEIAPETFFQPVMGQAYFSDTVLEIVQGDGTAISSRPEAPASIGFELLEGADGVFDHVFPDGAAVVAYTTSRLWDLKYVSVVPRRVIGERLRGVGGAFALGIAALLAISAALTVFFVRKNYDPVGNLVKLLGEYGGRDGSDGSDGNGENGGSGGNVAAAGGMDKNEFHFISRSVESIITEKRHMESSMAGRVAFAREAVLTRLLLGEWGAPLPAGEILSKCGMEAKSDLYAVLCIMMDERGQPGFLRDGEASGADERERLLRFVIRNVAEELASEARAGAEAGAGSGYLVELRGNFALVVNFAEGTGDGEAMAELRRIGDFLGGFMLSQFGTRLIVAAGMPCRTLFGIESAYREAAEALAHKLLMKGESGFFISEMRERAKIGEYFFPFELERSLISALKNGDGPRAQKIVGELFDSNGPSGGNGAPFFMAQCLAYDILGAIFKLGADGGAHERLDSPGLGAKIHESKSAEEMRQMLCGLCHDICVYNSGRNHFDNSLRAKAEAYIGEHYSDTSLSMAGIAERLGLHPAYLSSAFKEQAKIGILDYITRVRVERSMQLLGDFGASIGQISLKVGYASAKTFTRVFKKNTGITPSQYRELLRDSPKD